MPPERWEPIAWIVREAIARCASLNRQNPITDATVVAKFFDWSINRHGYEAQLESLFTVKRIVSYARTGAEPGTSAHSMQNRRAALLRMAEVINPGTVLRLPPVERKATVAPCTDREVSHTRSAILNLRHPERRRAGRLLIALGRGAGLAAGDIRALRVRDIETTPLGVTIHVPEAPGVEAPRTVPVLRAWEDDIRATVRDRDPDEWALLPHSKTRETRLLSNFTSHIGDGTVTVARLRAAWLVEHLSLGTPTIILRDAYGAKSLEALNRYAPFAIPLDEGIRARLLRGEGWN